ncbi:MAG: class I SAM-dependent methyltransferase [Okeania sp. SIO3I5]|uniref:class I SAM-dependent methyltransferase n=1 Tax=Okeania sp. SIO3I5 TaxID=2607805 RepID=UPI0013BBDF65|nr:class I SAM-dependent methyltransferase [Okeania sp. SIO3I5]NEQ39177.1 class I SAM-dependent methyltransferase [Okeania sp. SIO3I5]
MLLQANQRTKLDDSDDRLFYSFPRFVTHVDEGFIDQLTNLYRDRLQPHTRILDMMSSWISHLPEDIEFAHVEGHGMNEEELAKNRQLSHYFVQNFNQDLKIPFPDKDFDAVLNCASIQYLQYPDAIFYEIHRILKPGGIAIISFSNRMFAQKAIAAWRDNSEEGRVKLVKSYFESVKNANGVPGFSQVEVISQKSNVPSFLQMLGLGGGDPFYVVIAYRQV